MKVQPMVVARYELIEVVTGELLEEKDRKLAQKIKEEIERKFF